MQIQIALEGVSFSQGGAPYLVVTLKETLDPFGHKKPFMSTHCKFDSLLWCYTYELRNQTCGALWEIGLQDPPFISNTGQTEMWKDT